MLAGSHTSIVYPYGLFYITLLVRRNICIHRKHRYVITHPCPNFNGGLFELPAVEARAWMSNCIPYKIMNVANYAWSNFSSTLLHKNNAIYLLNAYLIDRSSIFWSNLLTWHSSGVLWGWCEIISYAYDYSSSLYDHSKSVRFEKRDIKMLATGTVFGGYFIIRDGLLWELKLILFRGIEMKLVN